jgi:hypothetical protein
MKILLTENDISTLISTQTKYLSEIQQLEKESNWIKTLRATNIPFEIISAGKKHHYTRKEYDIELTLLTDDWFECPSQ